MLYLDNLKMHILQKNVIFSIIGKNMSYKEKMLHRNTMLEENYKGVVGHFNLMKFFLN
jgi:hypothetical protein